MYVLSAFTSIAARKTPTEQQLLAILLLFGAKFKYSNI
jgi:hypothetical protein